MAALFFSLILPPLIFAARFQFAHQLGYFFTLALLIGITTRCNWISFASNNRPEGAVQSYVMNLELFLKIGHLGLFNDPLFDTTYTPAIIASDKHPRILCLSYVKNTYLHSLAEDKAIHLTFLPGRAPADWPQAH